MVHYMILYCANCTGNRTVAFGWYITGLVSIENDFNIQLCFLPREQYSGIRMCLVLGRLKHMMNCLLSSRMYGLERENRSFMKLRSQMSLVICLIVKAHSHSFVYPREFSLSADATRV